MAGRGHPLLHDLPGGRLAHGEVLADPRVTIPALTHPYERLGPVGGRIVGEVLVGIIDADPESFRSVDPGWTPTSPARRAGAFGLADILVPGL